MYMLRWLLLLLPVLPIAAAINVSTDLKVGYFINLDRMPSRRLHMQQRLKDTGLPARRFRAVDWRRVAHGEFDRRYVNPQGIHPHLLEKPTKEGNGTVGCFLSHVLALERASKEVTHNDLVLILEDDIAIPDDWVFRLQRAIDVAPPDWQLLKMSGWGAGRVSDFYNSSGDNSSGKKHHRHHRGNVDTAADPEVAGLSGGPASLADEDLNQTDTIWAKVSQAFFSMFNRADADPQYFQMSTPFTEPATFNWGTLGWGTPNYFYSGTGAYVVRGSSIKKVIHHLRHQPINDLDAMMLSNRTMRFYEGWPHVFDLARDAFDGPGLHGRKAFDEFDNGTRSETDQLEATEEMEPASKSTSAAHRVPHDKNERLTMTSRGIAVRHARSRASEPVAQDVNPEHSDSDFDTGQAEQTMMRRSEIRAHNPVRTPLMASLSARVPSLLDAKKKAVPASGDYGHPEWLSHCAMIYLDVGSNTGVQVRKLFEPEKFSSATSVELFDTAFGAPEDRRLPSKSTGLCALGLEPNPIHKQRLQSLQENYTARGWKVHFYPFAAWKDDGTMMLDEAQDEQQSNSNPTPALVSVRTVNLGNFVKSLPVHSVKLMKVDIMGAEYETMWRMLQQRVLCQGIIDATIVPDTSVGDVTDWQDERSFAAMAKHIDACDCGPGGMPTNLYKLEDESFNDDSSEDQEELTAMRFSERFHERIRRALRQKRIMCFIVLAACVAFVLLAVQKYRGETSLDKDGQTCAF